MADTITHILTLPSNTESTSASVGFHVVADEVIALSTSVTIQEVTQLVLGALEDFARVTMPFVSYGPIVLTQRSHLPFLTSYKQYKGITKVSALPFLRKQGRLNVR